MSKHSNCPPPIDPEHNLVCSRCKKEQPKSEFYKTDNYYSSGRGYSYLCKTCSRASATASAKAKREVSNDAQGKDDGLCSTQEKTPCCTTDRVCTGPGVDVGGGSGDAEQRDSSRDGDKEVVT